MIVPNRTHIVFCSTQPRVSRNDALQLVAEQAGQTPHHATRQQRGRVGGIATPVVNGPNGETEEYIGHEDVGEDPPEYRCPAYVRDFADKCRAKHAPGVDWRIRPLTPGLKPGSKLEDYYMSYMELYMW